jgi:hypothetical protein
MSIWHCRDTGQAHVVEEMWAKSQAAAMFPAPTVGRYRVSRSLEILGHAFCDNVRLHS